MTLPPGTVAKLQADYPEGTRHAAKVELALQLLGNGLPPEAVELTLSQKFPQAAPKEIEGIVRWVMAHNPQPSVMNSAAPITVNLRDSFFHRPPSKPKPSAAAKLLQGWLNGRTATEEDLYAESPIKPDRDDFARNAHILMECLYSAHDCLNIVCAYTINNHGKANPHGAGKTLPSCEWCQWFKAKGVPRMKAGAWLRPNPVKEAGGSGKLGAVMDADVTAPRFLLLESDCLPPELQLAAIASFRLPIAAILTSGGASYHAWVHLNCHDLDEYAEQAQRVLSAVSKFGFDAANKNPSRLSRLPGVVREVTPQGDGKQRLIYLNPTPRWKPVL